MAKKQDNDAKLTDLSSKSSMLVYGMDDTLTDEDRDLQNVIKQTVIATKDKYGARANGKIVDYFNELNFGSAFADVFVDKNNKEKHKEFEKNPEAAFKKYMSENEVEDLSSLMADEQNRLTSYNNYRIIYEHIPECAQALDTYRDNIMSPDDFTKLIFNIVYDDDLDPELKKAVEKQLQDISKKYDIEVKAEDIIENSLKLGDYFIAVLSLNDDLQIMLDDPTISGKNSMKLNRAENLTESEKAVLYDVNSINTTILSEDIHASSDSNIAEAFETALELDKTKTTGADIDVAVAKLINENVTIGSSKEFLLERIEADNEEKLKSETTTDISSDTYKKLNGEDPSKDKKDDDKPLYINGSSLRILNPDKVVELKIDDICYGYYYAEEVTNNIPQATYLGTSSGREVSSQMTLGQNSTITGTTQQTYNPSNPTATQLNVGEQKLKIISDVFIDTIAKKVDKDFIRKNKQFKDFIYGLVRQNYIIKKGVKLTYFTPKEVIHFECPALYKKIVFFAKLYLATLTNDLLVKLGRSHDKRIFYVNTGVDANYEQAISNVIANIKTKEYKMDSLNDFNTILNLNPGRWDDYFMPTINGDKPIEIDTLQGMDVDLNNDFLNYLKNSMLSGIGIPRTLIDTMNNDVDFARTFSAQNSNFVRSVIRYQKALTEPFTRLYQTLYKNEYKYVNNKDSEIEKVVDISNIKVKFPSPSSLNMTNMTDQIQAAEGNADFIASQIIPPKTDGSTEDDRVQLKAEIIKDLVPSVDWEKYNKIAKNLEEKNVKKKINDAQKNIADAAQAQSDPYNSMNGYGVDPNQMSGVQ